MNDGLNLFAEVDRADGSVFDAVAGGRESLQHGIRTGQRGVIDLGEVVIGGGDPEDRNGVVAGGGGFVGEFYGGERFVDREDRAAEKADLLAGDRSGSTGAKARDVGYGLFGGVPVAVLALEDLAYAGAALGIITLAGCLLRHPFGEIWGSGVKLLNLGGSGKVIEEKPRGVRDLRVRETLGLHRQHSRDRRTVGLIIRNRSHSLTNAP